MIMHGKRLNMVTYLALEFSTIVILVQGSSCPSISGCECILYNLNGSQLRYDCKGGMSKIPSFPFNTVYITFDNNMIETVQAGAFENNVELFHLKIRRSGIVNLPENTFANNIKLMELWISWNQLELLSGHTFAENKLLVNLDISNNRIKILPNGIFDNNIELEKLIITSNQIKILPNGIFENNSKLRILILSDNKIETLPNRIFTYNVALEYIYCQNNRIESLPANIFSNNEALIEIDFSDNNIEILPSGICSKNILLQKIYFRNNRIKGLPANIFANNEALLEIDLSDNHLQILPSDIFIKNVLLQKIEMTFNCTCIEKGVYAIIMREIVLAFEKYSITCYGSSGSLLEKPTTHCLDFIMLDSNVNECDVCVSKSTTIPQSLNEGSSITTRPQIITGESLNTTSNDDISAKMYFAIATALSVIGGVAPVITMVTMIVRKNLYRDELEFIQTTGNRNWSEENIFDSYWEVAEIDINELDFKDRTNVQIINIPPACHETSL